jgi:4-phytase / acid phosphatase
MLRGTTCLAFLSMISFAYCAAPAGRRGPADGGTNNGARLQFVIYLSRHGVRSPTGNNAQYDVYSTAPWPKWNVPPGYLTAHGYQLMEMFGAYDRLRLSDEGLFSAKGCSDAAHLTLYADSDQRTRQTGKALAAGMFPGCAPEVKGLPEGTPDALFHPLEAHTVAADPALAAVAIGGRIGGDPTNATEAYRAQLAELDRILSNCGDPSATPVVRRESIFEVPAKLAPGSEDHLADLRGPLNTAATLTEIFLLEYAEGLDAANVGWGCVSSTNLASLLQLHTAASEITQRTKPIARVQASNLLHQVLLSLTQAATGKPATGAIGRIDDRALFLIGHDTNLASIAGALDLHWIADGRSDDTPPGGALVFELWHAASGEDSVRVYFTAQTLEQMRSALTLSMENPPARVPVFVPACSRVDFSCSLGDFEMVLQRALAAQEP